MFELYAEARAFALSTEGLGLEPEGAKRWAQDYVSRNGYVHGAKSLGEQYAAAKAFAQSPEGLHVTSGLARAWALDFLNKCGVIDGNQSVDEQHGEATEFAKSSLMMISSYAKRWAARFVLEHVKRSQ